MIKEFWQERREEKKRQKQLKKDNKKYGKTKEQIAYKVFGIIFTLFLIFGSIGYSCYTVGGFDDFGDYSWESLIGVTDEMKTALTTPVEPSDILVDGGITSSDWVLAQEELTSKGIDIVQDGKIMLDREIPISEDVEFSHQTLGAIVSHIIGPISENNTSALLSFKLYLDESDLYLQTVCSVNLSKVVLGSTLPIVYITTTSRLEYMSKSLHSLEASFKINLIEDELNSKIVNVINNNILSNGLDYYTNGNVVQNIATFASIIGADANKCLHGDNIVFKSK